MADPKVRFKRSSVQGKIPNATQVPLGEIAINTYDGKIFSSKNVGVGTTVYTVNPWDVGVGTNAYDISFTAGKVGIGTTNPPDSLSVSGRVQIQQDSSSSSRLVFRGQPGSRHRWSIDNNGTSNDFRIFREDDVTTANGAVYLGISTTGTVSATRFSGDGSLLTGIVAPNSGVVVQNQGSAVGTAGTLNFSTNLTASFSSGTATISLSNNPSISGILTADQVYTSNNGNGQNVRIGDDAWIGDINVANTIRISGTNDPAQAFIVFGNSNTVALGRTGSGPLYYGGNFLVSGLATANSFRARGGSPGGLGVNNNGYGFFGSGDNDSGMYSSADGQIEFYSNSNEVIRIASGGNFGIGTTNPTSKLSVVGDGNFTGVVTATTFIGALTGTATTASSVTVNSVGLGTHTYGDYVKDITGTATQITVTSGTGEGSTPTLSIPSQFTAPQDVTVTRDLQVNRNLNVNGNITIGGTAATLFTTEFKVFDPDIVLGFRTDALGNDISTDNTANHGGIAIASTEGAPLVSLYDVGLGETNPATYKKFMWFKANTGSFTGLGTDAWLSNYAIGIGSTQFPTGTRLAAGNVQFTQNDLSVVRNINASGITTTSNLNVSGVGTFLSSGLKIRNPANTFEYSITGGAISADRTLNLPVITGTDTVATLGLSQTFSGSITFGTSVSFNTFVGSITATNLTAAQLTLGGLSQTGTQTFGQSTQTNTVNFASGASGVGTTKTINLGTGGLSGSFTDIKIGPTAGVGTVAINTGTNLGIGSTSPRVKLDVVGDGNFTGVVTATSFSGSLSAANLTGTLGLSTGGTNASLTASNGGIVYSTASAMAILSGTATAGQMLRSGASGAPSWSTATFPSTATSSGTILRADGTNWVATTATYPATTTINRILYSSAANTIGEITTANTSALVTSSTGVPSFTSGTTANRVLRTDGTTISFAQVTLTTDVTGTLPIANGGTNATATPTNGGVSYGTGSAYAFTSAGTSGQVLISSGAAAPVWSSNISVTGIITATDFNSTSDIRLKTNIQKIDDPIEKVLKINGVSFNWKNDNRESMGVIAQEVEEVLPQLVSKGETKTVNYNGLIGLLIESIKDQQEQINVLKNEIEDLKNK